NGGSFGGLFHHHNGSSGGGYGSYSDSNCDCGCGGSEDKHDVDHRDNREPNRVSDRDDRAMEAPSRDVNVYERNRYGRRNESRVIRESSKDDRNAEHRRDSDRKKGDKMKKDENKDRDKDKDKDKDKDNNKKSESK